MGIDLSKFGVDAAQAASISHDTTKYPKQVPNRVAHIDADFMAYQVSAESKAELDQDDPTPRKSLEDMRHNAKEAVDFIRRMAGAERAVLHTTQNSDKGGRDDHAILKEYQANRKDRDNKPLNLELIRAFLGDGVGDTTGVLTGHNHMDQEADDGMTQAAYADFENAIVCSADKDLDMVPGLRLDMTTYEITDLKDHFGWIDLKEMISPTTGKKYSSKVIGRGTKFFWAQLLMGDGADNISGLPQCPGSVWQQVSGTAAYKDLYNQWINAKEPEDAAKIEVRLQKLQAKTKPCGPVLTMAILDDCKNDKECYLCVRACYVRANTEHGYEYHHWKTDKRVTPTQAMLSEMRLLWMRRERNTDDVLNWIKETLK
jgi:hypothetical protein